MNIASFVLGFATACVVMGIAIPLIVRHIERQHDALVSRRMEN